MSIDEPKTNERPNGDEAVAPSDFFAFGKVAPAIGDRHFVNAKLILEDFGGDLGLDVEGVAAQADLVEDLATKQFVASLHVGQLYPI